MRTPRFLLAISLLAMVSCGKESDNIPNPSETRSYTLRQTKSSKRGVCFNSFALPETDIPNVATGVSWCYNWSSSAMSETTIDLLKSNNIAWYPMCWNGSYNESVISSSGAEYLMGFNEPNLTDQANMTPAQAAELWPAVVKLAKSNGMKVVSPALNYGTLSGYNDPIVWLDEFLSIDGISLDDIDAIALHCYMPNAAGVKSFIARFEKYGKPIWLTEFCNGNGNNISEQTQIEYMSATLNMLEQNDLVEKYAWFMMRAGSFNSKWHNSLLESSDPFGPTNLGTVYFNMSTFDDSIVYSKGEVIPAEQYCAAEGNFALMPTSDSQGILDITNFNNGCKAVYHISVPSAGTYTFTMRYLTYNKTGFSFGAEGGTTEEYELQDTGKEWVTESFDITLPAGKSDLVIKGTDAYRVRINWMMIN